MTYRGYLSLKSQKSSKGHRVNNHHNQLFIVHTWVFIIYNLKKWENLHFKFALWLAIKRQVLHPHECPGNLYTLPNKRVWHTSAVFPSTTSQGKPVAIWFRQRFLHAQRNIPNPWKTLSSIKKKITYQVTNYFYTSPLEWKNLPGSNLGYFGHVEGRQRQPVKTHRLTHVLRKCRVQIQVWRVKCRERSILLVLFFLSKVISRGDNLQRNIPAPARGQFLRYVNSFTF